MNTLTERQRTLLAKLNHSPRKLSSLRLRGDTRSWIQDARQLREMGLVESQTQGRELVWRTVEEREAVFHAPDALPDEQPGDYAIRVAEAYKEWLAVPLDPLPALVRNLVEVWADAGEDAACEVLRRWLDQDKNH